MPSEVHDASPSTSDTNSAKKKKTDASPIHERTVMVELAEVHPPGSNGDSATDDHDDTCCVSCLQNSIMTLIVRAVHLDRVGPASAAQRAQSRATSFLLGIFILDFIMRVVKTGITLEIVDIGPAKDRAMTAVIISFAEALVEAFACAVAPFMYKCVQRESKFRSRALAIFVLKAYAASATIGCVLYPVALAIMFAHDKTLGGILLAVVFNVSYGFCNQIGDSGVEMAKPHWLPTFENTALVIPGFPVAECVQCRCCKKSSLPMRRQYRWNVQARASSKTLGYGLVFLTVVMQGIAVFMWLGISAVAKRVIKKTGSEELGKLLRVSTSYAFCVFNAIVSISLLVKLKVFAAGVQNHEVVLEDGADKEGVEKDGDKKAEEQSLITLPWKMQGYEVSLFVFAAIVFESPKQAFDSLQKVLPLKLTEAGSSVKNIFTGVGGIGILIALFYLVHKLVQEEKSRTQEDAKPVAGGDGDGRAKDKEERVPPTARGFLGSRARTWIALVWALVISLAGAAMVMQWSPSDMILFAVALPLLLPFYIFQMNLESKYTAFLIEYPDQQSSNIVYWQKIVTVVLVSAMAGINIAALENDIQLTSQSTASAQAVAGNVSGTTAATVAPAEASNEDVAASVTLLFVVVSIFAITAIYYSIVDPCLSPGRSLYYALNQDWHDVGDGAAGEESKNGETEETLVGQ